MESGLIASLLSFLERDLIQEIISIAPVKEIGADAQLIREGQFIQQLPIILQGSVKVYSQVETKELLLYYIRPSQSCIMSFSAAIYNSPSMISAVTMEPCKILLVPVSKVNAWILKYPGFNRLFFDLYHDRYIELLDTINHLLFTTLDQRILKYLLDKANISGAYTLALRHHEIARDLGTAREVVTRILKKLESDGKIKQTEKGIRILVSGD